ncbi:MAG: hypothetical protein WCE21_00510 [Candidatus Babeliales bacterium]
MKKQILFSYIVAVAYMSNAQAMNPLVSAQHWTAAQFRTAIENCTTREELIALQQKAYKDMLSGTICNYIKMHINDRHSTLQHKVLQQKPQQQNATEVLLLAMQKKGINVVMHPSVGHADKSKFSPLVLIKNGESPEQCIVAIEELEQQAAAALEKEFVLKN